MPSIKAHLPHWELCMDTRPGYKLIFVAYVTTKSGKRIYASSYGLQGFAIWVRD